MEVDEQDYFLMEALCIQSGVEQPQARLINSKLHLANTVYNMVTENQLSKTLKHIIIKSFI